MTEDVLQHISLKLNQRRARKPIGVAMAFASAAGAAAAAFIQLACHQNIRHSSRNVRRILDRGVNALLPPEAKKILKI